MTMRILMMGAVAAATMALAGCGLPEDVRKDFCKAAGTTGKSELCKCYIKGVQDAAGDKAEAFIRVRGGDDDEKWEDRVKELTRKQEEEIAENLQTCREDKDD